MKNAWKQWMKRTLYRIILYKPLGPFGSRDEVKLITHTSYANPRGGFGGWVAWGVSAFWGVGWVRDIVGLLLRR